MPKSQGGDDMRLAQSEVTKAWLCSQPPRPGGRRRPLAGQGQGLWAPLDDKP